MESRHNGNALVQKRKLPHAPPQGIVVVIKGVEYLVVNGALEHDKGRQHRQEHGGDGGELVKGHLHTLYLVVNTGAHVDDNDRRNFHGR